MGLSKLKKGGLERAGRTGSPCCRIYVQSALYLEIHLPGRVMQLHRIQLPQTNGIDKEKTDVLGEYTYRHINKADHVRVRPLELANAFLPKNVAFNKIFCTRHVTNYEHTVRG